MKTSKQILPRLKAWLLQGKTITPYQCLSMWKCSRLAVYIHRLRRDQNMKIHTEIKYSGTDQ